MAEPATGAAGTAAAAPKPPPWRYSDAKKRLTKEILDGTIAGKGAQEVHAMHADYFQYNYDNFSTNLRNLRALLVKNQGSADSDAAALAHDEALGLLGKNSKPYPRWQGSEAERCLQQDIDNNKHKIMTPQQLKATRQQQYGPYPLKVFSDHIQQELRARRERPYWMARKAEKEARKAKKTTKKKEKRPPPQTVA